MVGDVFYRFDFAMGFMDHFFHQHLGEDLLFFANHPTKQIEVSEPLVFFFKKKHPLKFAQIFVAKPTPIPQSNNQTNREEDEPRLTWERNLTR